MPLTFPVSPTLNQVAVVGGVKYQWDGVSWNAVGQIPAGGTNTNLSILQTALTGIATDPYYSSTELLLLFNGAVGATTIVDSSSRNRTVTNSGSLQLSGTQYKLNNTSLRVTGGTYLSLANTTSWNLASQDGCVDFWLYLEAAPTDLGSNNAAATIIGQQITTSLDQNWSIYINTNRNIGIGRFGLNEIVSTAQVPLQQWTYIAVDKYQGTTRIYINRDLVASSSTAVWNNPSNELRIGAVTTNFRALNGYIGALRFTTGVSRYGPTFEIPNPYQWDNSSWGNLVANISGNNSGSIYRYNLVCEYDFKGQTGSTVTDKSGNGRDGTITGSASWITSNYKRGLNLTGGYLDMSRTGDYWITTGELTCEIVYLPMNPEAWSRIVEINSGPRNDRSNQITLISNVNGTNIPRFVLNSPGAEIELTSPYTNSIYKFRSFTLTVNTSGLVTFYEGLQKISEVASGVPVPNVIRNFAYLGRSIYDANGNALMVLAGFRLYNKCLTDDQRITNFRATQAALLADGIVI